jgi:urea transport system permease protein
MTNAPALAASAQPTTSDAELLDAVGSPNYTQKLVAIVFFAAVVLGPVQYYGGDSYQLPLYTKYLAIAIFALSVDLIWGYSGLLSLGQGLYFGIGAYAMGYSLILQQAALDSDRPLVYAADMIRPAYMLQCRVNEVPVWIGVLINHWLAFAVALTLPTILAGLFGWIVFRRGIKGVYFSLITQALLLMTFTLVRAMRPYTGGVDGLTSLASLKLFGYDFEMIAPRRDPNPAMYYLIASFLAVCFLGCALLMASKVGRLLTAIRDNENRVLALGYNIANYKTFIFTLAGFLAGLAGALYVAANGSAGPQFFSIADSIEIVIIVAVGGRGTLIGPIVGAVLVGAAKTYISDQLKVTWNNNTITLWPIVMGVLFIVVVLFLPDGLVGGGRRLAAWVRGKIGRRAVAATA